MKLSRRSFTKGIVGAAGLTMLGPLGQLQAARNDQLNILCWEGYNSDDVLGPFRVKNPDATIRAESGTSDPDMINKLRAGEVKVWDLINVNQPWAKAQLYPEKLIKPLNKQRFLPYFEKMLPEFQGPYPLSFADNGALIGMTQRFGPFSFVVNTNKISRKYAEDQGYKLFLDSKMKGRYGVLTYDNWNIMHMCLTGDQNPFTKMDSVGLNKFRKTAKGIFGGAKLLTDDLVAMNTALINGEIDAYFTGGTYTASPARLDGATNIRGITPNTGPVGGKGGIVWIPVARLKTLRDMARVTRGLPASPFPIEEAEPPINVEEELASITLLLESHASFSYTLLQTEMYTNHYAKKHAHPTPGLQGFGDCPECIELYAKQTTAVQPISKIQYETLLKIEKDYKAAGAVLSIPNKSHGK